MTGSSLKIFFTEILILSLSYGASAVTWDEVVNKVHELDDRRSQVLACHDESVTKNFKPESDRLDDLLQKIKDGHTVYNFNYVNSVLKSLEPKLIQKLNSYSNDCQLMATETEFKVTQTLDEKLLADKLSQYNFDSFTVRNPSATEITQKYIRKFTKEETIEVIHSETLNQVWDEISSYDVKGSLGFFLKDILNIGGDVNYHSSFEKKLDRTTSDFKHITHKEVREFSAETDFFVKSNTSIDVKIFSMWMTNVEITYESKLTITGIGPKSENSHKLSDNKIRELLSHKNPDFRRLKELSHTSDSVTYECLGTLILDSGTDTQIKIKIINGN